MDLVQLFAQQTHILFRIGLIFFAYNSVPLEHINNLYREENLHVRILVLNFIIQIFVYLTVQAKHLRMVNNVLVVLAPALSALVLQLINVQNVILDTT